MPIRIALNIAYAMLTDGLDAKQKADFDSRLYGWDGMNEAGNKMLRQPAPDIENGGEG